VCDSEDNINRNEKKRDIHIRIHAEGEKFQAVEEEERDEFIVISRVLDLWMRWHPSITFHSSHPSVFA
jgi:hypothetical protein